MIQLLNVSKKFNNKQIIHKLNLCIERGERIAIIGPSGCGKSTLLRLILGLITPDSGQVMINDQNLARLNQKELTHAREEIGFLFQSAALFDSMTVEENVGFALRESDTHIKESHVKSIINKKLELVGMSGKGNQLPASLSGGQKKRIGLARALAKEPSIMLYDEPTTGLDPVLSTNIEDLMVNLSETLHVTSIVITHQISTMLRTSDKIYFMHEGKLLDPETPETVYNSKSDIIKKFIRGGL